jgi:hypothetical protein
MLANRSARQVLRRRGSSRNSQLACFLTINPRPGYPPRVRGRRWDEIICSVCCACGIRPRFVFVYPTTAAAADAHATTSSAWPGVSGAPTGNACATTASHRSSLCPRPPLGRRAPRPCGFVDSTALRAEPTANRESTAGFTAAGFSTAEFATASLTADRHGHPAPHVLRDGGRPGGDIATNHRS